MIPARVFGVGLGLRWEFIDALVDRTRASGQKLVDFLEVPPENYIGRGGRYRSSLAWLAQRYPIVTHGLTLSLGGTDPLDAGYLRDVAALVDELRSPWHSDHLCFGAVDGRFLHELLPVPFHRTSVRRIADRIRRARDAIGVPLAIENVSWYWHPGLAEMNEAEFLAAVCEASDCRLLLDVNNAYVNATNFGWDLDAWMRTAPLERVVQIHVAGHEWFDIDEGGLFPARPPRSAAALIVDTHGAEVADPVMDLLGRALERTGPVPVLLERDQSFPGLDALVDEVARVKAVAARAHTAGTPATPNR